MNPCNTQSAHGLWLLEKSPEKGFLRFSNHVRLQEPEPPLVLTWLPLLLPKRTGWEGEGRARGCPGTRQCNCCDTVNCSFWPLGLQIFLVNKSSYCVSEMHPIILCRTDWKMLYLLERLLNNIVSTYKALSLKSFSGQHRIKIVILKLWTSFWQIRTDKS